MSDVGIVNPSIIVNRMEVLFKILYSQMSVVSGIIYNEEIAAVL
jgi:hypothetical protein